jgi:excisionase family DNA binding protein
LSLTQLRDQLGISEGLLHKEIKAGRLSVARVGRRILVPVEAADAWLRKATRK